MMSLSDIYLVSERLSQVGATSFDALEASLGIPLPLGYREYLTQLGAGEFSGVLHVYPPEQVKSHLDYWKETGVEILIDGLQVGMLNRGVLSAKKLRESVMFGHTDNGDKFVSTPSAGDALFAIPRDSPTIRSLRHGFLDPLACCRAVGVTDVSPWFEPRNGHRKLANFLARGGGTAVEQAIKERWGGQELRRFDATASQAPSVYFGVRAIQGMVRVHGLAARARSIGVGVSFDADFAAEVRSFAKDIGAAKKSS
jgi:hypothetical protein